MVNDLARREEHKTVLISFLGVLGFPQSHVNQSRLSGHACGPAGAVTDPVAPPVVCRAAQMAPPAVSRSRQGGATGAPKHARGRTQRHGDGIPCMPVDASLYAMQARVHSRLVGVGADAVCRLHTSTANGDQRSGASRTITDTVLSAQHRPLH